LVGCGVGLGVGVGVGLNVGASVGTGVGLFVGSNVGLNVGASVGCGVGLGLGLVVVGLNDSGSVDGAIERGHDGVAAGASREAAASSLRSSIFAPVEREATLAPVASATTPRMHRKIVVRLVVRSAGVTAVSGLSGVAPYMFDREWGRVRLVARAS
jgi:hypothetical protein